MNLGALGQAGRSPELPKTLEVGDLTLHLEQWLRTLPGKRYVARSRCNDTTVLAKLWTGNRAAAKLAAETKGIKLLQKAGLPTPEIIDYGETSDGAWLITRWLEEARTLADVLGAESDTITLSSTAPEQPLGEVSSLLHTMHAKGIVQDDIHPGNFLRTDGQWWIVDAADIRPARESSEQLQNLGTFMAQLPEDWEPIVLRAYGIAPDTEQAGTATERARQWRSHRAQTVADKSLRDCTLFQVRHDFHQFESRWREDSAAPGNLDEYLKAGKLLKDGGSATVGLIEYGGRDLVLKRYNLKNWRHWLKRFWRPTRAWHSWWAGHRLRVLGVSTPKPVALREERWGPCRGRGFLITEVAPGTDIIEACLDEATTRAVALQIRQMLEIFAHDGISHGDFKGTNLMWDGRLHLIDLDAVQWHSNRQNWRKAFNKDMERLLRNWPEDSMQHRLMSELVKDSIKY